MCEPQTTVPTSGRPRWYVEMPNSRPTLKLCHYAILDQNIRCAGDHV